MPDLAKMGEDIDGAVKAIDDIKVQLLVGNQLLAMLIAQQQAMLTIGADKHVPTFSTNPQDNLTMAERVVGGGGEWTK